MVEGSQVDWAGHANDPVYMVTDFIEFDETVGVALDFAERNPGTVVIAFSDHNTGGMTIGNDYFGNYTATSIADIIEPLTKMQVTAAGLASLLPEPFTIAELKDIIQTYWGLTLTDEDAAVLVGAGDVIDDDVYDHLDGDSLTLVLRKYLPIGWTTHGHTGGDVPLWASGFPENRLPASRDRRPGHFPRLPVGFFDNTDLARLTADQLRVSLERAEKMLYVKVEEAFDEYQLDDTTDPANPVLIVNGYQLPTNKDELITPDGTTLNLDGLTVYFENENDENVLYVPAQAVRFIKMGKVTPRPHHNARVR